MVSDRSTQNLLVPSYTEFASTYIQDLANALNGVPPVALEKVANLIFDDLNNHTIFVCGNGGSASTANHFVCDWLNSLLNIGSNRHLKVISLSQSQEIITATANDYSYDVVFTRQLQLLASDGDLLIVFSASGNSPNVIHALHWAKANRLRTIAFTGFDGGQAKALADAAIHVDCHNYGIVEDAHLIMMHTLAQYVVSTFAVKKS